MERLEDIEKDLGERENEFSDAADDKARLSRDWDYRLAIHQKTAKGPNKETRMAVALVAAIEQDDLYEKLKDAEARYDALRVVTRSMETRTSIGQSLLKAHGRA